MPLSLEIISVILLYSHIFRFQGHKFNVCRISKIIHDQTVSGKWCETSTRDRTHTDFVRDVCTALACVINSVTRLGDFLHFGQLFKAFVNN